MNPLYKQNAYSGAITDDTHEYVPGLTKLEVFTMAAMQGILGCNASSYKINPDNVFPIVAEAAVAFAKATLDALAKEQGVKIE